MNKPFLNAATSTSITVKWLTSDIFNGGVPVTSYAVRIDDGPKTDFQVQVTSITSSHSFTGLL